jgi:hypothetical protein
MRKAKTRKIEIAASPANVFRAVTMEVHNWWTTLADDASVMHIANIKRTGQDPDQAQNPKNPRQKTRGKLFRIRV